jgi:hypothetical protein
VFGLKVVNQLLQSHVLFHFETIPQSEFLIVILQTVINKTELIKNRDTFDFGAEIGSENPKNGKAKLTKPFLYASSFFFPSINLYNSKQTRPVTREVVVAMAGIILPAIPLVLWRSAG